MKNENLPLFQNGKFNCFKKKHDNPSAGNSTTGRSGNPDGEGR